MRRVIVLAAAALGAVAACGGSTTEVASPAPFSPQDVEPRCDLKPDASAKAKQAREALMASWTDVKTYVATRKQVIAAFANDLGVEPDESLVVDALSDALENLGARGCQITCGGKTLECEPLTVKCAADPSVQPAAEKVAAIVNRHWPKLRALEYKRPKDIDTSALDRENVIGECDTNLPSDRDWYSNYAMIKALSHGSITSIKNECPGSFATCKAECDAGNGASCASAWSEKSLSEEQKADYALRACGSKEASEGKDAEFVMGLCTNAFASKALDTQPALRDRALSLIDKLCERDLTDPRCVRSAGEAASHEWFKARPLHARIVAMIPDKCEALGTGMCASVAGGFHASLSPAAQTKILALWRKKCDGGEGKACETLAFTKLGSATADNRRKDLVHACDLEPKGCYGVIYCFEKNGCDGIAIDATTAKQAYGRVCDDYKKGMTTDVWKNYDPCKKAAQ